MNISEHFDFRMDRSSWLMILFIIGTMMFFMINGAESLGIGHYFKTFGMGLLVTGVLLALMSIPVAIYCYAVKVIPDIDYSVRAAFAFTIIGIISELI